MRLIKTCLFTQERKSRDLSWLSGQIPGSRTASRRQPTYLRSEKLPAIMNSGNAIFEFSSLPSNVALFRHLCRFPVYKSRLMQTEFDAWSIETIWKLVFCVYFQLFGPFLMPITRKISSSCRIDSSLEVLIPTH